MNSPFGRGDGLTGNLLTSTTRGLMFGLVNYTTPVGSSGLKLGASVSAVRYQLDKDEFPLDLTGDAVTVTGFGLYPVIRSRNLNFFSLLSLEHKQFSDKAATTLPVKKSSDTLAIGGNGDFRDSLAGGGGQHLRVLGHSRSAQVCGRETRPGPGQVQQTDRRLYTAAEHPHQPAAGLCPPCAARSA